MLRDDCCTHIPFSPFAVIWQWWSVRQKSYRRRLPFFYLNSFSRKIISKPAPRVERFLVLQPVGRASPRGVGLCQKPVQDCLGHLCCCCCGQSSYTFEETPGSICFPGRAILVAILARAFPEMVRQWLWRQRELRERLRGGCKTKSVCSIRL